MTMTRADILVIGAGPAGLAVSASLRDAGLAHTLVERETDVATSWRRHYTRLHLHTVRQLSTLPGMPWPAGTPKYPSREAVVAYLTRYAATRAAQPTFGVEVRRIARDGERFVVDTNSGTLTPRFVVVATGYNGVPTQPDIPGLATFPGSIVHSSAYRDAASYTGKRTLVVGCGNSGAEIALDLAEQGVDVSMVVRGPVHVVPRDLFGRGTQQTAVMLSRLPVAMRDAIIVPVLKLVVGDLSQYGIVRPRAGPQHMIVHEGRMPILDIGTIAQVKAGRITVRPGVASIEGNIVRFANGAEDAYDAIVCATGYTTGLESIIDGFAAVTDARHRPRSFGAQAVMPGLYLVGFRNPPTGALREIALEAPAVAAAIKHAASALR